LKAIASVRNAARGVGFMFSELSIRALAVATVLTIGAGAYFSISTLEWCAILLALGLVWAAEGLNTALERLTDLVSPDFIRWREKPGTSRPAPCCSRRWRRFSPGSSFSSPTSSNIPSFKEES